MSDEAEFAKAKRDWLTRNLDARAESEQEDFGDCNWGFPDLPPTYLGADPAREGSDTTALVDVSGNCYAWDATGRPLRVTEIVKAPAFITGDWSVEYPPIAEQPSERRDVFPRQAMR